MKKLLLIATRLFWPTDSGRKVSLYHYCRGLYERYGYEIYVYSFLESGQTEKLAEQKPPFIKEVKIAHKMGTVGKLWNLFVKSMVGGWPFQNAVFYSGKNARSIREYAREIQPDVVMVDMIRLAPYYSSIKDLPSKKILDMDDLLSKRYERQSKNTTGNAQVLGTYEGQALGTGKRILKSNFVKNFVLKSESKRVARAEKRYGKMYDGVIFVSEHETKELNRVLGEEKAITVRLGVDYDYYAQGDTVEKESCALGFLGNLRFAPNVDSLHFIEREILPKLSFEGTVYVIGVCPDEVKAQFTNEKIKFLGRVEDVRPVLKKCEIFLSPIAYGSGVKTKILEAMAMGLPVVTNPLGVEGIDGEAGKHFIVEQDAKDLAAAVDSLHTDSARLEELSKNAQALVREKYRWEDIFDSFGGLGL